jgi:hypothetical protein
VISRGLAPCVFFDQRGPDLLEFAVIKDSLGTALNIDFVSSVYKSFGGGWCEGRAVFKGLAHWRSALATGIAAHQWELTLGAQMQSSSRHDDELMFEAENPIGSWERLI